MAVVFCLFAKTNSSFVTPSGLCAFVVATGGSPIKGMETKLKRIRVGCPCT